ncbi:MAG: T9SS type A sorting domain-containing protein [Ignavibacteriales bacterium]|nr:T9SS type A sorting domain-containing protein [Ignavibacteriales bacterium]
MNTSHFVIERGEGDGVWTEVASKSAAGNSNTPLQYRVTDNKLIGANTHYRLKSVDNDGTIAVCKIIKAENTGAVMYSLKQNFPNPLNPTTIIRFTLPEAGFVRFSVFSVNGEEVYKSSSPGLAAGYHEIPFNGANLAGGVYLYRVIATNAFGEIVFNKTKKMMLLK